MLAQKALVNRYVAQSGNDVAVTMRSAWSHGDRTTRSLYRQILDGETALAGGATGGERAETIMQNGQKTVRLSSLGGSVEEQLLASIVLGHEAYRDGEQGPGQRAETEAAARAHTEMALRIADSYGMGLIAGNENLNADVTAYMAGGEVFGQYVGQAYDSSADYWKLMEDGSLEYYGDGWLKDPNGNYIRDENGDRIGARGVQGGLEEILGISSGEAVSMLQDQGFELREEGTWWEHDGNNGNAITLGNGQYASIYEQQLDQHNTRTIYENLVAQGRMDTVGDTVLGPESDDWNGRQPEVDYISYEQWKNNNFISNPEDVLSLDQAVESDNLTSAFGTRTNPFTGEVEQHSGNDWGVPVGTSFTPYAAGEVAELTTTDFGGNTLTLEHQFDYLFNGEAQTSSFMSEYMHLMNNASGEAAVTAQLGDLIGSQAIAGYTGNTGNTTGAHLHAGIYFEGKDPFTRWLEMAGFESVSSTGRGIHFDPLAFME